MNEKLSTSRNVPMTTRSTLMLYSAAQDRRKLVLVWFFATTAVNSTLLWAASVAAGSQSMVMSLECEHVDGTVLGLL